MRIERIEAPPSFDGSEGLLALIIHPQLDDDEGTHFVTRPGDALQVGVLNHGDGWESRAHQHSLSLREVRGGGEVLVFLTGSVSVKFYDSAGSFVCGRVLHGGDILIQYAGGHSFKAFSDFHAVEVKQGPYRPEDKTYLPTTSKEAPCNLMKP